MEGESEGVSHSCDESMEQDDSVFEKEKVACDENKMEDHIVHRSKKFDTAWKLVFFLLLNK